MSQISHAPAGPSASVGARQKSVVEEFSKLADWESRYKRIIEKGKNLPPLDDKKRVPENLVKGCQSQVWLHAHLNEQGFVVYEADSDAMITKGLVAVLLEVFSNARAQEILESQLDFIKQLGFESHLSPSRANGFYSMVKQMRHYATAFYYLQSQG